MLRPRHRRPCRVVTALCLLAAALPAARADDRLDRVLLPGESGNTARALEAARKLVAEKKWAEAVEEYQRLLDAAGDDLVPLDGRHCLPARRLCHLDLSRLPAEALRLYRDRADAQARRWLDRGAAERDERLLRRVAEEAFCSTPAARALDLLGDLAFERGRFAEAEAWWRLLAAPARAPQPRAGPDLALVYPAEGQVDVARARAKQLVARLFQGERGGLEEDLKAFAAAHAKAEGALAGRTGRYADTLQALARDAEALAVPPAADGWPTFAGDAARSGAAPWEQGAGRLARLCGAGPHARFDLETRAPLADAPKPRPSPKVVSRPAEASTMAFCPVIAGDRVLVADARTVTAYDFVTGKAEVWFDLDSRHKMPGPGPKLPAPPHLRCTLTVAEGHVLARLGAREIGDPANKDKKEGRETFLACLRLDPGREGGRLRWLARPASEDKAPAFFEGAPLAHDGRAYVAVTRFAGGQALTAVHCYPLRTENNAEPAPLWRQDVCAVKEEGGGGPRYRHHLLALAGPNVVYASHSGAVVAVDALSGRRAWAVRYPGRGPKLGADETPRDLAPCLYAAGRLYAAPADCGRLLCLDPATGQALWDRDGVEVVHLLGVAAGRLVFTTPAAIRAVDAATGRDVPGWHQPGDGGKTVPAGRGLLLGEWVLWPTFDGLFVLRQEDGQLPDDLGPMPLARVPPGNLACANGCLAVAGTAVLDLFVAPARRKPP